MFNVVDSGFMVNLGAYSAPNQPHNPNQPRSLGGMVHRRTLRYHWAHQYHGLQRSVARRFAAAIPRPAAARAGRTNAAPTQWVGAAFTLLRLRAYKLALAAGQLLAQGR
jgi:hypothetical protein